MGKSLKVVAIAVVMVAATQGCQAQGEDDPSSINDPSSIQPFVSIPLRNNSGSELFFFLSEGNGWQKLMLRSGAESDVPRKEVILAVPTSFGAEADTRDPVSVPDEVYKSKFVYSRPYFYRKLTAGERWELCWSQRLRYWLVQSVGEGLCK